MQCILACSVGPAGPWGNPHASSLLCLASNLSSALSGSLRVEPFTMTIRGMEATCSNTRFLPGNIPAGCEDNKGDVFNQCRWKVRVPRPGGTEWFGLTCFGTAPNVPPAAKPPKAARPPPSPPPATPVPAPGPRNPCLQTGPSEEVAGGRNTDCSAQASCLDLVYDSRECTFRPGSDGVNYLYCKVCVQVSRRHVDRQPVPPPSASKASVAGCVMRPNGPCATVPVVRVDALVWNYVSYRAS